MDQMNAHDYDKSIDMFFESMNHIRKCIDKEVKKLKKYVETKSSKSSKKSTAKNLL